ncbi:hypothetical protein OOZ15_19910, partial [Galbibacter sp. EGI 63066]|uniref:hypothetical protein n=1 Tax=Galbibacter sp. EGI 63066 TaxID=2993559 RepID=UPI00224897E5
NQLYGLQIVNIPIKHYEEDYYKIEVFNRGITDEVKTSYVRKQMEPHSAFSIEQMKTIELIYKGFTSKEIAAMLNKTKAAVYKLNRKILEKISNCFEIEFGNVCQAVGFYAHCFNIIQV